ncbi:probable RNA-directed DNA polymerase from transposon X-element [Trichonephila clavipes]|nr:probable RNA-directed DNA polymerase from transposon X-element [Trichonephila clavipes]
MISKSPIGLSLCSWNANGILSKITELKIFIEQHSPDLILIQETHLRPSHNINIANYTCYRNDRPTSSDNNRAFGGTLLLVKNAINHYSLPTPPMQTIEATIVILTPFDHDPISIVSVYIPPNSDEYTFTIDIENLIQTSSNCVLFGDFNAPHTAWNCNSNSSRGVRLLDFTNLANLYIAYPDTPTRFGINSANTLDIAIIRNFYYSYTINSLHELSSDHNPVMLNFTLKLNKDITNPRANVKKELKNYTNENWTARLQALSTQDNSLWAVQKFFKNKRSDIPSLHCTTGTAITDKQKADILAESILTNFTENERHNNDFDDEDGIVNTVNAFLSHPPPPTAETAYPSEIISYIKSSNPKKAPGKSKNNPASYRPISLLSTLSKITESIILTRLKNIININKTINPNQYGFTNKLSTLHPLLNLTEAISEGFQRKKSTGAVFLDIQKAFDRVWLTRLTFKLITYNIPPPLICLLHSYNSDRSYQVRVKDTLSNTKNIRCGVAQGSLLGPLLFNLYINDIPDYTLTKLNMFADDTAVHTTYRRISSVTYGLNKHLKILEKYYDQWKISINVEKSAAVIFTKKRKLPPPPTMYNTTIPWSQSTKYLGIIFDKNLTWRTHIQHTRNKFRKIMFKLYPLIGRNSELSRDNKVLLFTAVMRPILAYGCPVWGYAAKTNINILDTLQNSTIRMIGLFSDKPELTHVLYHEIDTGDKPPVVSRPYRYGRVKQEIIDYHVDKMLREGPIKPIQSPYASPVSDEAHFCLNGYVSKQNCHIWGEANLQVYVETPLHPEKLTVWCALWAGGIIGP